MACPQGAALFFSANRCGGVFAFPDFYLSTFVQALQLLFDSGSAFEDVDSTNSRMHTGVHDGLPQSLHLLVGFGEDGEVKCALAPSYLFKEEAAEATAVAEGVQRAFAKQVLERPVPFGAGVMQFVLTIARGTFALPLAALRKARRLERDDGQAPNGGDGIGDSGAADGGTMLCDTSFSDRLGFASTTCNMFWHYHDREVRPARARAWVSPPSSSRPFSRRRVSAAPGVAVRRASNPSLAMRVTTDFLNTI
jgi:hypothetical protein